MFVPNVNFDIVLFEISSKKDEPVPIVLSLKTSTRERYKQSALEGYALKNVFRNAESFLLTHDDGSDNLNDKINSKDLIGIDKVINTKTKSYDEFLLTLSKRTFQKVSNISIIDERKLVTTFP